MATKLNEQELRSAIRTEIKNALKEASTTTVQKKFKDLEIGDEFFPYATKPNQVGGSVWKKIKSDNPKYGRCELVKLAKRPSPYPLKADKLGDKMYLDPEKKVWVIDNENAIKEADGTNPKPLQLKGGLSAQQLGGAAAMRFAEDFIAALETLDDVKKAKAIGYVLARIGMDPVNLQKRLGAIKTSLKQYTK